MGIVWDGITRAGALHDDATQNRHALADAAKSYNWPRVFDLLSEDEELVNTVRPDGVSWYAPLHQAAHGGAPVEVAQRLIGMRAFRTLQNARGERPVDVAERQGHRHLLDVLAPQYKHRVPIGVLLKVQVHFHQVIRGRVDDLVDDEAKEPSQRLPELEPLLELDRPRMGFGVPGMYGGFNYCLETTGVGVKLVSESWSRVAGGSGQRHEITSAGSQLVEEGFV